jgi:hypothetical protein
VTRITTSAITNPRRVASDCELNPRFGLRKELITAATRTATATRITCRLPTGR